MPIADDTFKNERLSVLVPTHPSKGVLLGVAPRPPPKGKPFGNPYKRHYFQRNGGLRSEEVAPEI